MRQWQTSGRDEGALLRGAPLAEAEGWLLSRPVDLNSAERSFIEQSRLVRSRQRQRLVFGLSLGLVGALSLAGMAGLQWQRAEKQRQIALFGQLAAQASLTKEQFEFQQTEALLSAMRTAHEFKKLTPKGAQAKYPVTSPILALQTILDKIREQKYSEGSHGTILEFTPKGDRVLSYEGLIRPDRTLVTLLDSRGNQLAKFKSPGLPETAKLSPDGQRIVTGTHDGIARLWDLQGNQLAAFKGHQGMVEVVQFSPDGRRIVTGDDNTARLWDLQGNQLAVFGEGDGRILDVQFSPKGDRIFILRTNVSGRIPHLWDLQGNQLAAFNGHQGRVEAVQFSPDGKRIVTGGQDNTAILWDLQGNQLKVFKGHQAIHGYTGGVKVNVVQFSPDSQRILTGGTDRTARLWDLQGNQLAVFKGHESSVTAVQFSPDGKRIATGSQRIATIAGRKMLTGNIVFRLWNLRGNLLGASEGDLNSFADRVFSIQFSPDGKRIAAFAEHNTPTHLWHLQGNQLATLAGQQGTVQTVKFSPDGKHLATLGEDGTVRLWNHQGKQLGTFKRPQGEIEQVRFSPKGDRVFTVEENGIVRVWNLGGKQLTVLKGKWGSNWKNPISPDGKYAVTEGGGNSIQISDLAGNRIALSPQIPGSIHALQFSPKGDLIAIAGGDGMVHLWDFRSNKLVAFKAHSSWVNDVYFTPDGDSEAGRDSVLRLMTITPDGLVQLWNLKGDRLATVKKGEFRWESGIHSVSDTLHYSVYSPKSGRFVYSSHKVAFLWDVKSNQLAVLQGREGWFPVLLKWNSDAVQLSSDGNRIATLGEDGKIRIWDSKGNQIAEYEGYAMALSPDGKQIVVVSNKDNIPRMWQINDLDGLLKKGCDWLRGYIVLDNGNDSDRQMCGITRKELGW
jgi:WD40 repeat protein